MFCNKKSLHSKKKGKFLREVVLFYSKKQTNDGEMGNLKSRHIVGKGYSAPYF